MERQAIPASIKNIAIYRDAAWLMKRHAVTVFPSVGNPEGFARMVGSDKNGKPRPVIVREEIYANEGGKRPPGNCGACSTSSHPLSRDPRRGKWRLVFIPGCQYFHSRRLASNRAPRGRAGAALDTAPSIPGCSKPWARWEVNSAEPARKPRGARHKNSIARVRNH
jgi:hypothetical protein